MQAYKYITDVDNQGHIYLPDMPTIKSSKVEIIILPIQESAETELQTASESSLSFWDNKEDEVWDNV